MKVEVDVRELAQLEEKAEAVEEFGSLVGILIAQCLDQMGIDELRVVRVTPDVIARAGNWSLTQEDDGTLVFVQKDNAVMGQMAEGPLGGRDESGDSEESVSQD